jgi:hypothetical protein
MAMNGDVTDSAEAAAMARAPALAEASDTPWVDEVAMAWPAPIAHDCGTTM